MKVNRILVLVVILCACWPARAQPAVKLTLKEAEETALKNHPQISAALMAAMAANQIPTEINASRYPNFFASASGAEAPENTRIAAGGLNNPSIFPRMATGFSVNQLLLDFGRTGSLAESSWLHAKAVEQNAEATRAQVLLQVDRAYFLALRAEAVLKVAEQTVAARQVVAEQAEALQKSGLKSGLDVSIANYNLAESRLLLARSQNEIQAAFAELSAALGGREEQTFDLSEDGLTAKPLPVRAAMINQALLKRPELNALQFERDAAYKFLKAEKSLKLPSVSAVWSAGFIPFHDSRLGGNYNAAGFNINIPIFNGRLFQAREAEAEYKAKAAEQNLLDLGNRVSRDVRLAWLNADTAYQRIGLAAQLLSRAREALDLAQERYRLGLSSIVELSQAQLNVTVAEIENANAKYDYLIQRAVLDYQSGQMR
jgi:outer membrane protein